MAAAQVELPFERQLYLQAERLLMAGLSQRELRVGRRKPVLQYKPTSKILLGCPTAGDGR